MIGRKSIKKQKKERRKGASVACMCIHSWLIKQLCMRMEWWGSVWLEGRNNIAVFGWLWLVAGADLLSEKNTAGNTAG